MAATNEMNASAFKKKSETGIYYLTYKHILSHASMSEEYQTQFFNNWDGVAYWMNFYANLPDYEIVESGTAIWRESDGRLIPDEKTTL